MFGASDLRSFFADFGVVVAFQGVSTYSDGTPVLGNFDRPEFTKLGDRNFGGIVTAAPDVRLPYNAFSPMPGTGDQVNVDGTDYTVSEQTAESDGAIVCYELKKVTR